MPRRINKQDNNPFLFLPLTDLSSLLRRLPDADSPGPCLYPELKGLLVLYIVFYLGSLRIVKGNAAAI